MTSPDAHDSRESRVLAAVAELVDSLLDDFDVVELLTQLTEQCVQLLDVASAALLLADARDHLHLMAATSERTQELELFQLQTDEGPCLDCFRTAAPVSAADLAVAADRWPRFVPAAQRSGFLSVHAMPMRAAGTVLGALGLFGTGPGTLNDADVLVGQTLAHIASVAIVHQQPPSRSTALPSVHSAIAGRVVVEQAKGYLSARLGLPTSEAFVLLRRYSHQAGAHLTDVARQLISDPVVRPSLIDAMTQIAAHLDVTTQ